MENQLTIKSVRRQDSTVTVTIETEAGMENMPVFMFRCDSPLSAELLQKSIQRSFNEIAVSALCFDIGKSVSLCDGSSDAGLKNHSDANNEATAEAYEQGYLQGWDDHRKKNRKAY